ncbi:DUF305 domain-containing protein [Halotalea alkalilenta]|uniref:DUF305 domain-containing protein n=1 Tax=Halotalea alkalilenta TaxID=376489 RepID=UPI000693956D|nr:DUF305 domain-containing protein [Halotalea alkalilenta]
MAIYQVLRRRAIAVGRFLTSWAMMPVLAMTASLSAATAFCAEAPSFAQAARSYVERIESHPPSGDVDQDFAAFLVPQHLSGVELSSVAIDHCQDATLRDIAADILAHADRNDPVTSKAPPLPAADPRRAMVIRALAGANAQARAAFEERVEGDTDRQFAHFMGAHHQRAIVYASTELHFGRDPNLLTLARTILEGQQEQHAQMMKLLDEPSHDH